MAVMQGSQHFLQHSWALNAIEASKALSSAPLLQRRCTDPSEREEWVLVYDQASFHEEGEGACNSFCRGPPMQLIFSKPCRSAEGKLCQQPCLIEGHLLLLLQSL